MDKIIVTGGRIRLSTTDPSGNEKILTYFTDGDRPRRMVPLKEPGPVWLFGLLTVNDAVGRETLLSHFTRRESLAVQLEHGIVQFNDDAGRFEKVATLDLKATWRFPRGTVFIKHFELTVNEATGERKRLETRLLVRDSATGTRSVRSSLGSW